MAQTPIIVGATGLVELPDSPKWKFTVEKGASVTRTFKASTMAIAMASRPPLNAFGTGIYAGMKITDVSVEQMITGIGKLSWTMEGLSTANGLPELPPDTCTIEPTKQEFRLAAHPRYDILPLDTIDAINASASATKEDDRAVAEAVVAADINAEAAELLDKVKKGESHFILYLPVYKWTIHSLIAPTADIGGYPQTPYGPMTPPTGFDWLREADSLEWTGTVWKLTRTWQSGLDIDPNLYPVVAT